MWWFAIRKVKQMKLGEFVMNAKTPPGGADAIVITLTLLPLLRTF